MYYLFSLCAAPPYADKHRVILADWNYPNGLVSELVSGEGEADGRTEWGGHRGGGEGEYTVDLSMGPPPYEADIAYINRSVFFSIIKGIKRVVTSS